MRAFIILLLLLSAAASLSAQPFLNVGVRAGGNSSSMDFEPNLPDRNVLSASGFQIGGTLQYIRQRNLGVQLDAIFMQQGWREVDADEVEEAFTINYLKVPFTTFAYVPAKRARFFINAGLFISYRLSGEKTRTVDEESVTEDFPFQKSRDNLFVYGLTGGGGVSYDTGYGIIGADIRADFDFGSVFKPEIPTRDFSRLQTISISGFYQFPLINKKAVNTN